MNIFNRSTFSRVSSHIVKLHLVPEKKNYDELLNAIGSARIVLIGEASHGTHEFYRERALITKRLIEEKDFTSVAVEGDFPDIFRINQYVQNLKHGTAKTAREALEDFTRFPLWMWRNYVMLNFVEWVRRHNDHIGKTKKESDKVGICGLDIYSLHRSADAVIEYLQNVDPKAAEQARSQYDCFERFGDDTMLYAFCARYGLAPTCEKEAMKVLQGLKEHTQEYLEKTQDGFDMENDLFSCLTNAFVVEGAERYYRVMLDTDATSWNIRDDFMARTFQRLLMWKTKLLGRPAKAVIWAHNSHLGDASFTEMGRRRKEHNVGQLLRERFGSESVFNIGFSTYTGEVTCASDWGQKHIEKKKVVPGMDGSYEKFFHQLCKENKMKNFLLIFKHIVDVGNGEDITDQEQVTQKKIPTAAHPFPELPEGKSFKGLPLSSFPLARAIGVIYRPDTERQSHYFEADLSEQFDAVIHLDETCALLALDDKTRKIGLEEENLPELFPSGL